jgi:hypothetical protein
MPADIRAQPLFTEITGKAVNGFKISVCNVKA